MSIVAYALIAIGGLLSLLNWGTLLASWRGKRFVSAVPLVGALPLGCGLALLPETRAFAWLALVADYGTVVLLIAVPSLAYQAWSTSRVNLLHAFSARTPGRDVAIKLYRRRVAVITATFDPPAPCNEYDARVRSFGLVGGWDPTASGFTIGGYDSDRQLLVSRSDGGYVTEELNYPDDRTYRHDCLGGLVLQEQV